MLRALLYIFLTVYLSLISHAQGTHKSEGNENTYQSNSEKLGEYIKPQYFINHLGCKKSDGEKEIWDTDKYIWEIGKNLQNKEYSIENFMKGIDQIFEKAYKFKNDFSEVVLWSKDKKPINSEDLNIYKKEREEFKKILKEVLLPFEEESKSKKPSLIAPFDYRKSYSLYKERVEKLNKWKEKYPQKIKILCPKNPENPENAFQKYEKDAHSENFQDNQHPPLNILANHVVNSMGCEEKDRKRSPLPLWYVGGRIQEGEFSLKDWKEAFKKELDESMEKESLNKKNRIEYENRFNNLLSHFENSGLKDKKFIDNYSKIRSEEVLLQQWVISKKILDKDKFPCDSTKTIEGRGILDQAHYSVDCLGDRVEKKLTPQFENIKKQIETLFYDLGTNIGPNEDSDALRKEKERIEATLSKATLATKVEGLSKTLDLAKKFTAKHSQKLARMQEPRLNEIILKGHMEDIISFWTKNFAFNNKDPNSKEGKALLTNYISRLSKNSNTKMLLSCFESNGRIYLNSTHGKEANGTTYLAPGIEDSKRVLQKMQNFDIQTNWGTSQISFDQSYISSPAGRYYHDTISNILRSSTNTQKTLKHITSECQLETLLSKGSEKEVNEVANELLKRMKNSEGSNKNTSKKSSIEDFAYIQQFCLPIHLNLASKIYELKKGKYFGSLDPDKGRIEECKRIGNIENSSNTVLDDINNYILGVLKETHKADSLKQNFEKISAEEIKEMQKTFSDLDKREKEIEKNYELFENLKNDSVMTNYLTRLQESSLKEAWKVFNFSDHLTGWKEGKEEDKKAKTGPKLKLAIETFLSKDSKEAVFENAQKERRERSLSQLNKWIEEHKGTFKGGFANQLDDSFSQLKNKFETMNDLYDAYEKELSNQIRQCVQKSGDNEIIATMLPTYMDPSYVEKEVKKEKQEVKKPLKSNSKSN